MERSAIAYRADPFLAECVCGRAHRSATLGGAQRWAEWHQREGCEGCDHVIAVRYAPGRPGGAQGIGGPPHLRSFSTDGLD